MQIADIPHITRWGLRTAAHHWRLLLPLYLSGLLLGLVQTWPVLVAISNGALHNLLLSAVAYGDTRALIDLLISVPLSGGGAVIWALLALLLTAIFSMLYNIFSGGIVSVYAGTRTFWSGSKRMFWAFTGLGVLLVLLGLLLLILTGLLVSTIGSLGLVIGALALALLNTLGEYARVLAVVNDRHNPLALILRAAHFILRSPIVLIYAVVSTLLYGLVTVLYTSTTTALPSTPWIILWQQAIILAGLWIKLLRLAWAVGAVQTTDL